MHTHIHTYTHIHAHMHADTDTDTDTHTHTHTHTHKQTHTHTHTPTGAWLSENVEKRRSEDLVILLVLRIQNSVVQINSLRCIQIIVWYKSIACLYQEKSVARFVFIKSPGPSTKDPASPQKSPISQPKEPRFVFIKNPRPSTKALHLRKTARITDHELIMTLHHTATQCNVLQHCNTLRHTETHCNTLQHTAILCKTLQDTATHCNSLQLTATHCNTLQHTATHCDTLQHTPHATDKRPFSAVCNKPT